MNVEVLKKLKEDLKLNNFEYKCVYDNDRNNFVISIKGYCCSVNDKNDVIYLELHPESKSITISQIVYEYTTNKALSINDFKAIYNKIKHNVDWIALGGR